jgi:hypothetical protein
MDQFVSWCQRISESKIDDALRTEIADKILELLLRKKDSMNAAEELLLGQAITGLAINVDSIYLPADLGLEDCLSALRKVMAPRTEGSDANLQSDDVGDFAGYEVLVADVDKIKMQINQA